MRGWKVAGLLGELGHIGVLVPHGGLEGRDRRRQIQDSGVLVPHEGLEDEDSRRSEGARTVLVPHEGLEGRLRRDRTSTRLNSSHSCASLMRSSACKKTTI